MACRGGLWVTSFLDIPSITLFRSRQLPSDPLPKADDWCRSIHRITSAFFHYSHPWSATKKISYLALKMNLPIWKNFLLWSVVQSVEVGLSIFGREDSCLTLASTCVRPSRWPSTDESSTLPPRSLSSNSMRGTAPLFPSRSLFHYFSPAPSYPSSRKTYSPPNAHTNSLTRTLSLSLSLSHTHTYIQTQTQPRIPSSLFFKQNRQWH